MITYFTKFLMVLSCTLLYQTVAFGQFRQIGNGIVGSQLREELGRSTAISQNGEIIAVGMPLHDGPNRTSSGRVQIYQWNGITWQQQGLDIVGTRSNSNTGSAISMNAAGTMIAIGSVAHSGIYSYGGLVRIYEWDGTAWIQKGLDLHGLAAGDNLGSSVSMSSTGNTVAIGAVGNPTNAGYAKIYEWNGTAWVQKGVNIIGEAAGDKSGHAVSINANGDVVAIGAYQNDGNGNNAGHVRTYEWDGTTWIQKGTDIDGEVTGDESGYAVSINAAGNILAIGAYNNSDNGSGAGHVRIYEWSGTAWVQKGIDVDGEAANDKSGYSISISASGNMIAIGAYRNKGIYTNSGGTPGHVRIYEWNGTAWIQKAIDIDGEARYDYSGWSVSLSANENAVIISSPASDLGGIATGAVRVFELPTIYGQAYFDVNQNCQKDTLEIGLANRRLIINPGKIVVQTDVNGYWNHDTLPIGNYTITTDTTPTNNYQACATTYSFSVTTPDSSMQLQPIGYQAIKQCTAPAISINAPFLRPGFSNQKVYVRACNESDGTAILDSAYAIITLDSLFTVDTASLNYSSLGNDQYRVDLIDIYPSQCINFWLSGTLSVNATLGSSLCMEAALYPIDSCALDSIPNTNVGIPCTTPYDFSHLIINSACINNTMSFTITNVEGAMNCWSQVRLYMDGVLVRLDSVQLQSGQSQTLNFAGDGRTWRMEVDQHPLHWGNSQPSTTIELCGNAANWTSDLVNILPQDDADPVIDIYCGLVRGSYDPNDKTGFPTGIGTTHDILPNQNLEYIIRFQNTGTDTAFTVVIRDTLSTDFDIFSVQPGVSSHDYNFRMYGPRVLEWTFSNIMLPDSNVNEPLSNGFVKFEVQQQPNLPNGTLLENSAGIYFDFNTPIITNTSIHTINDGVIFLDLTEVITKEMALKVYPNPTQDYITIELSEEATATITILNNLGQVILSKPSTGKNTSIQLKQLPAGIYYLSIHDGVQTAVQKIIKQ
ncbi:MAG: DUF7619 domain-containing protein [Aureispira sp.]